MRMRFKRKAVSQTKKEEREFNKKKANWAKARAYYRKKHPRKRGEKRGRPRLRSNEKFKPSALSNGDTKVELLTRARYILPKSGGKWSENQKKRAKLLFEPQPKLKEAYSPVCQLRCIFKNRKLTKTQAKGKLKEWYKAVSSSGIKEIISALNTSNLDEGQILTEDETEELTVDGRKIYIISIWRWLLQK